MAEVTTAQARLQPNESEEALRKVAAAATDLTASRRTANRPTEGAAVEGRYDHPSYACGRSSI